MSIDATPAAEIGQLAPPEPEFAILGARSLRHAAVPSLLIDLQVSEPLGHRIYMIALTVQLMLEPARRPYDDETRERLVELFGPPPRWSVTTRSLVLAQLQVLVPAFTGSIVVPVALPCSGDLELAATKYLHALPEGQIPLAAHFNGTVYYARQDGALQMVLVPWNKSIDAHLPLTVWRETLEHYYPNAGWLSVSQPTLDRLRRHKLRRGLATMDECVAALLEESDDA